MSQPTASIRQAFRKCAALIASMPEATGATVLISSHLLGEMEQMVTQVGIIHHGKMLFEGALRDLKRHSRAISCCACWMCRALWRRFDKTAWRFAKRRDCFACRRWRDERLAALVCALADSGAGVVGVNNEQTRRLEEIFLSLTQNGGEAV